ncbi:MAG: protein kinase, partial [Planctomycetota bacterium]|nr:protein kinase [Planctomycetota bacterium]
GLAKILGAEDGDYQNGLVIDEQGGPGDTMKTMTGSAIGTPAYMPPEQALGRLDEIDHRSDVYSLGAILYEILTLQRPFTGKTANEILVKVTEDRLVAPIKRAPERNIPKELAAIAVKAMAHDRRRRYQSVGELQQDINLYLEGRAVSAKDDSAIEAISKLIKRNKTASLAVAGAFVVILLLTAFFVVRLQKEVDIALANEKKAQASEQTAIAAKTEAERAKDAQRQTALKASRRFALRAIDAAKQQLWLEADRRREDAESVAADSPWPLYAQGMFEELKNNYEPAKALYQKALSLDANCKEAQLALAGLKTLEGEVADASKLLSGLADETDWKNLLKIGRLFTKTGKWKESVDVYRRALDLMKNAKDAAREKETKEFKDLLDGAEYAMVDAGARLACVGFYESVKHLKGNKLFREIDAKVKEINGIEKPMRGDWWMMGQQFMRAGYGENVKGIRFLYPLQGLPIQELTLIGTQMRNADSLAGLPVKRLSLIYNRGLKDISGLRGMPVASLRIHACPVADISPLKGMELNHLELWGAKVRDISPLAGMPLVNVSFKNSNRIKDLTPLEGAPLKSLALGLTPVSDLSPLRNMPLEKLAASNTPIKDLSPLSGLKLKILSLDSARVSDLSPLKGVPLEALNLSALRGGTLEALRGMPLKALILDRISFKLDLSPLAQSPLERLSFVKGGTADITPIRELKTLKLLRFDETQVEDLSPLSSLQLEVLSFSESQVTDISPLAGLPLKELMMNKNRITEIGALKKITTLEKLHMQYLKVTDLSPLTDLKNLAELDMKGVPATSIRPLAALRIKTLHIQRMPLTDLTPLATIRPRVLTLSEKNNYSKESLETVKELTAGGTKVTWDKM